jgi:hypothetical protein
MPRWRPVVRVAMTAAPATPATMTKGRARPVRRLKKWGSELLISIRPASDRTPVAAPASWARRVKYRVR